jgi:hypothetical protein
MAIRTFSDTNSNDWSWEETPETIEALKQLHNTVKQVNENKTLKPKPVKK